MKLKIIITALFALSASTICHAAGFDGSYVCGNSGLTVNIGTNSNPTSVGGRVAWESMMSIEDEAHNLLFSGDVYLTKVSDDIKGRYGLYYPAVQGNGAFQVFDDGKNRIKVYQVGIDNKPIPSTALYCAR